jgi:alpha-amylase
MEASMSMKLAPSNGVILQAFDTHLSHDGNHWMRLRDSAADLAHAGFTAVWLPPAFKGAGGDRELGYGVYDFYDLGEFDQKGSVRTKYGTRADYLTSIARFRELGVKVYVDIAIDHLLSGDNTEKVRATGYSEEDRNVSKGSPYDATVYTHFAYEARQGKYSNFQWHWHHFSATGYNADQPSDTSTVLLFEGKSFDQRVSLEKGNFDYLMGCNIDFTNEEVKAEIKNWGKWYLETTKADGVRIDAAKHISFSFLTEFLGALNVGRSEPLYAVAEYWEPEITPLHQYISNSSGAFDLFDVPLHYKFSDASKKGADFDMSTILDGTLMKEQATLAVTFVENHDTQPLGSLESDVQPWFKPLAYSIILLRRQGYPCVFYADYYGSDYEGSGGDGNVYKVNMPSFKPFLDLLLHARGTYCHGEQRDYLDHASTIGWTFDGDEVNPRAMAVLLSNSSDGRKEMFIGRCSKRFVDITGSVSDVITSDAQGNAVFRCNGRSVSVWIEEAST